MKCLFFKKIKLNIIPILKLWLFLLTSLGTLVGLILMFFEWEELNLKNFWVRLTVLLVILIGSFFISALIISILLKRNKLWSKGKNKLFAFYGDLFKTANSNGKKIIAIPVNDSFETIIDDDLTQINPLVSKNTIHGMWIEYMIQNGFTIDQIDNDISMYLKKKNINPQVEYTREQKQRGKLASYKCGTVVPINGPCDTTFYLIPISKFNEKKCKIK